MSSYDQWFEQALPSHTRLKDTVVPILENLLRAQRVDYLSVSGRTKEKESVLEKIKRKGYSNPSVQLTDMTGIRVIVFLESDVAKASEIIKNCFSVDIGNSLDKSQKLAPDQIGYRSVHFVCDIGAARSQLPEFAGLANIKFEIQVRTVLQHAWAELSHDRSYKFHGQLPTEIEREIFLYAGMLEIADKGFEQIAKRIDEYSKKISAQTVAADYTFKLDSISLPQIIRKWARDNFVTLDEPTAIATADYADLLNELHALGIGTAEDLLQIIPKNFAEVIISNRASSTIFGYVRDWMILHDWRKLLESGVVRWSFDSKEDTEILEHFISGEEIDEIKRAFWHDRFTDLE